MLKKWVKSHYLLLLSIIILVILRLPFYLMPLLFMDEAQIMAFGGKLLHGGLYGLDIVDTRGPGSYYISALIAYLFGYGNIIAYHITGLLFNCAILLMIFVLASKLYDNQTGQLSSLFFVVFSYSYKLIDSLSFNVETMALPFLLLSSILFYYIYSNINKNKFITSFQGIFLCLTVGILCSAVFSIKQVLASCLMAYFVMLWVDYYLSDYGIRRVWLVSGWLAVGFGLGLLGIYGKTIILTGWENTVYWSYYFGYRHYAKPILISLAAFLNPLLTLYLAQPFFWVLSLAWLLRSMLSLARGLSKPKTGEIYLFLLISTQFLGAIIPGRKAFHYLVPLIPFLSIAVSSTLREYFNMMAHSLRRPLVIFTIFIVVLPPVLNYTIWPAGLQSFDSNVYSSVQKELDKKNLLNQSIDIIKNNSTKDDTLYVVSNGYEFYPLSKQIPATIPLYIWYFSEYNNDQYLKQAYDKVIADLNNQPPKTIIIATRNFFKDRHFDALKQFLNAHYSVEVIDSKIGGIDKSELFGFGKTFDYVEIYKRID